ncbi:oxidoreductase, partial [Sphingomonas sp. MG17]|nr:oxidoreductase [Sphingomonas tagetis]
ADMLDTKVGQDEKKADPAKVARDGWDALMAGQGHIVSGLSNKLQVLGAGVVPQSVLAEQHRKMAEPGGGER